MLIISVLTQQPWILIHHHGLNPLHANYPKHTNATPARTPTHAHAHTHTHKLTCLLWRCNGESSLPAVNPTRGCPGCTSKVIYMLNTAFQLADPGPAAVKHGKPLLSEDNFYDPFPGSEGHVRSSRYSHTKQPTSQDTLLSHEAACRR